MVKVIPPENILAVTNRFLTHHARLLLLISFISTAVQSSLRYLHLIFLYLFSANPIKVHLLATKRIQPPYAVNCFQWLTSFCDE